MQLNDPAPASRAEALFFGGLTVATWVLVVFFGVYAGELERDTSRARGLAGDVLEDLRRLPATRHLDDEGFHVKQPNQPKAED